MSKLTSAQRNALPSSTFAGPGRSYPIPDRSHAANAKARASQQEAKGNLSPSEKATIDAKADRVLKNKPTAAPPMSPPPAPPMPDKASRRAEMDGVAKSIGVEPGKFRAWKKGQKGKNC